MKNAIGRGKEIFVHGVEIRLFPKKHQKVMNRITAPFKRRIYFGITVSRENRNARYVRQNY